MTKDIVLRTTVNTQIAARNWRDTVITRMRKRGSDEGASMVEYAGLVIIVAAIIGLVKGLNLDTKISTAVGAAVDKVLGGGGG
ncbi:hypothetical protein J7I98_09365 [Streptomyces sp. ISL-98]|uniref:hypothetical protein n=1 Tax=Streptomyces sp. ISL-98 TaxID=2819192 RepID=UPI001BEB80B7|nr:hypothetical protein [Streptomyces sp. ISL-98]MBT2506101.1 hypothetical protein [Streptomyces sp. ISL-98]